MLKTIAKLNNPSFFNDLFDKGAKKNEKQLFTIKDYLTIIASGCALVISLNESIANFLEKNATVFPELVKFIPLVFLVLVLLISIHIFKAKEVDNEKQIVYKYNTLIRQTSKLVALFSLVMLIYSVCSIYKSIKPIDQPIVLFVRDLEGNSMPDIHIRILNERGQDITSGIIETSTMDGMALLIGKSKINQYTTIQMLVNNKTIQVLFKEAILVDSLVFNQNPYLIIIK